MNNISMEITLHDFDEFGDCKADVSLPESGLLINQLVVKQGFGGGVMIHMPKWMHGKWSFPEVSWADVQQAVTQKYRSTPHAIRVFPNDLLVRFHSFSSSDDCLADVSIPQRQITVRNLKVTRNSKGAVRVHMPEDRQDRWDIPELPWELVWKTVSAEYSAALKKRKSSGARAGQWAIPQNLSVPQFRFHSCRIMTEVDVDLEIPEYDISIHGIHMSASSMDPVRIWFPFPDSDPWSYPEFPKSVLFDLLHADFSRTFLQADPSEKPDPISVSYLRRRKTIICHVDVSLPGRRVLTGFRLREIDNGVVHLSTPSSIGEWKDPRYPWPTLKRMVEVTYREQKPMLLNGLEKTVPLSEAKPAEEPIAEAVPQEMTASACSAPKKDPPKQDAPSTNEYGRVDNAENSPFRFFPHVVLRAVEIRQNPNSRVKGGLIDLVNAMSKGETGGIGPFELSVVEWASRLRYVTASMLMDLVKGGYINVGWRHNINLKRMDDIIMRMAKYDLLIPTQFVSINDDGTVSENARWNLRILTLGAAGNTLLHELGQDDSRYNSFDVYRDGNTVKRYLSTNQFLIYWLIHYPNLIGNNFHPTIPVFWRGTEYVGAWFYATVTLGDHVLVGECIRRVEDFEIAHHRDIFRNKVERMIEILSHPDELYTGQYKTEPIAFASRPIIVLICEDDDHIHYVRETLVDIMEQHPEQNIWFTTDLRIFNKNMRHQRFITVENEQFVIVDISEQLELLEDY